LLNLVNVCQFDSQQIDRQAKFSSAANGPVSPLFKASSDLQLNRQSKREMKKVGMMEEGRNVKELDRKVSLFELVQSPSAG
jgi:hypothetical protein